MKKIQKLILPGLIFLVVLIIYLFYFAASDGLDSFSDLDANSNAVKDIKVKYLSERGLTQQGGSVMFFVSDKNGKVVQVFGEFQVPPEMNQAEIIRLQGHISGSGFHAHKVIVD